MNGKTIGNAHWIFWVIAAIALVWNLMGVVNFFLQLNADALAAMPAAQRSIIESRPTWAGAAFAIRAARAGASVVLVERRGFDEMRPGEHLSGHVRGALDALQIPARDFAGIVTSSPGIVSLWTGGAPLTKPYAATGGAPALRVVRHRFDALLFFVRLPLSS